MNPGLRTGTDPGPAPGEGTPADRSHGPHQTIPSLDGFRALSVAIVLAGHAGISRLIPGGFGVTVFFFLSGFLITTLFLREARRHGGISLKAFYIRRLLRLSPPLFTTLLLVYALVAAGQLPGWLDPWAILSQGLYFYNYYATLPGASEGAQGFHVLWSLSVEEHFYLLYPFLMLGLLSGRVRLWHVGGLLAAFCAWRLFNWHVLGTPAAHIYMRSDTRFDSILWGCLLALWQDRGTAARLMPDRPGPRAALILAALGLIGVGFLVRDPAFRETWRYSLQGIALLPVFHYAVTRPDLAVFRPLNWGPVALIGAWSYSIYLIHYVILNGLAFHGLQLPRVAAFVVAGGLAILYAALLSRYVEAPVRGLRQRFSGHGPKGHMPEPPAVAPGPVSGPVSGMPPDPLGNARG